MAAVPTMADMDAFLINPTVKMSRNYVRYTADEWMPHDEFVMREAAKISFDEQPKDLTRDFSHKFILPREYTSEEEETTTSPSDDNRDSVFGSTSSEGDLDSVLSYDDNLDFDDADSSAPQALPLCAKAQPVYIISAGKAKIVSVASSAQVSPIESSPRSSIPEEEEFDSRFAIFGSSKTHQRARVASNNFSRTRSPERRAIAIDMTRASPKQTLQRLNATPTAGPTLAKKSQTPLSSQRASPVKQDPFPADWPLPPSPISPPIPKRRLPKIFTSTNPRRKISSASDSSAGSIENYNYLRPTPARSTSSTTAPSLFEDTQRSRYESPRRPKLIPRGASERAPPLILPSDAEWPLLSTGLPEHREGSFRDLKRKSVVATTQL